MALFIEGNDTPVMQQRPFEERLELLAEFIDRLAEENLQAVWLLLYDKEREHGSESMRRSYEKVVSEMTEGARDAEV